MCQYCGMQIKTITYDANDWQLFTATMDCDEAGKALTDAFNRIAQMTKCANGTYELMFKELEKYWKFGATDTEPRYALYEAIQFAFGEDRAAGVA